SVGATPSSSNNTYMRHIGAGFFTEWGRMVNYSGADFFTGDYWTSDGVGIRDSFTVHENNGRVSRGDVDNSEHAVCTTP
ncbi:hypothetical protein, partial [Gilliamella sp. Pas-s95]|uniref:hypothetical protein n=1 Tax=Gilliamella sp. Pas-s95 TaxID=2687317 RepID=UPI001325C292